MTGLALLAFAGNSVLCRLALSDNTIDAASFTSIRLFSGIIFLVLLVVIKTKKTMDIASGSWLSSFYLFLYAIALSYAYITLDTGIGALILFGAVQVTMIVASLLEGRRLLAIEWLGLFFAFLGLLVLLMPGASAPSLTGIVLILIDFSDDEKLFPPGLAHLVRQISFDKFPVGIKIPKLCRKSFTVKPARCIL